MTTNYEKKLLNEIKELKEGCVPKEILFAERSAHRREMEDKSAIIEKLREQKLTQSKELCALRKSEGEFREQFQTHLETMPLPDYVLADENEKLKEENEELKRNGGFVGDYATATSANALLARQKDSELKKLKEENEELTGEKEYWVKEYHDLKSKVDWGSIEDYSSRIDELITKNNKLYDENGSLKRTAECRALLARQKDSELKKLKEENEKLKETNQIRFDKIKEMENEVGVSKLVHHQNLGLLEENEKLKRDIDDALESYMEVFKEE
jgi:hypothetical protein